MRSSRRRGFTLLEVMIASALIAVVMGVVLQMVVSGAKSFRRGQQAALGADAANLLLDRVESDFAQVVQAGGDPRPPMRILEDGAGAAFYVPYPALSSLDAIVAGPVLWDTAPSPRGRLRMVRRNGTPVSNVFVRSLSFELLEPDAEARRPGWSVRLDVDFPTDEAGGGGLSISRVLPLDQPSSNFQYPTAAKSMLDSGLRYLPPSHEQAAAFEGLGVPPSEKEGRLKTDLSSYTPEEIADAQRQIKEGGCDASGSARVGAGPGMWLLTLLFLASRRRPRAKPAAVANRRTGTSLIEALFAVAVLGGVLTLAYAGVTRGMVQGSDLADRARADALARNLLGYLASLPPGERAEMLSSRSRVIEPPPEMIQAGGRPLEARGVFRRLPGEVPAGMLRTEVSWSSISGVRRRVSYRKYLLDHPGDTRKVGDIAGLQEEKRAEGWGRKSEWAGAQPARFGEGSGESASSLPGLSPSADSLRSKLAAGRLSRTTPVTFVGDPLRAKAILSPGGEASRSPPPDSWTQEQGRARAGTQLRARTGVKGPGPPLLELPDGSYPYVLEATQVDARDGAARTLGIYSLSGEDREYLAVAYAIYSQPARRSFAGDEVLERGTYLASTGATVVVQRTQERLMAIWLDDDLPRRRLELVTLPDVDGSSEGTSRTRRFVARWLQERRLVEHPDGSVDELEIARSPSTLSKIRGFKIGRTAVATRRVSAPGLRFVPPPCRVGGGCGTREPAVAPEAVNLAALEARLEDAPWEVLASLDEVLIRDPRRREARVMRGQVRGLLQDSEGAVRDLSKVALDGGEASERLVADLAANALRVGDLALTQSLVVRLKELAPESRDAARIAEDLKRVAAHPDRRPREILDAWNPWGS